MSTDLLDLELYTIPEAARILRVAPSTLRWWLEGRDGHLPIVRPEPTGSQAVTWGEFVEAGFIREYRKKRVSLQHLRRVVMALRDSFDARYPLAHHKPFIGEGRKLMLEAQASAQLPTDELIVFQVIGGQIVLDGRLEAFLETIDFSDDEDQHALRMHPEGRESPVVIDPVLSFGAPTVNGIRTEILAELIEAGEPADTVAEEYGLDLAVVHHATAYEWLARAA